jgi:hypothetical protein
MLSAVTTSFTPEMSDLIDAASWQSVQKQNALEEQSRSGSGLFVSTSSCYNSKILGVSNQMTET